MALTDFFEEFKHMTVEEVTNGEGGYNETLIEGKSFFGAIATKQNIQVKLAEKEGIKPIFTIMANKENILKFDMVIKRIKTNELFKITSNSKDLESPAISDLNICKVSAERI